MENPFSGVGLSVAARLNRDMEAATVDLDTPAGVLAAARGDTAVVNAGEARRMHWPRWPGR